MRGQRQPWEGKLAPHHAGGNSSLWELTPSWGGQPKVEGQAVLGGGAFIKRGQFLDKQPPRPPPLLRAFRRQCHSSPPFSAHSSRLTASSRGPRLLSTWGFTWGLSRTIIPGVSEPRAPSEVGSWGVPLAWAGEVASWDPTASASRCREPLAVS